MAGALLCVVLGARLAGCSCLALLLLKSSRAAHRASHWPSCYLPAPARSYVHRVGRTGRAGQSGTAISLLAPSDAAFAAELEAMLQASSSAGEEGADAERQQAVAAAAVADDSDSSSDDEDGGSGRGRGGAAAGLQPHPRLTKKGVEGLRYRAEDVARSITKNVIKEVRAVQALFVSGP